MSDALWQPPVSDRQWLVIGAPMEGSGTNRGEVEAPAALRASGLVESLGAVDFGDLPVLVTDAQRDRSTGIIGYQQLVYGTGLIADAVSSALLAGWRPLVLGGCCSVLPGALTGVRAHSGPARLVFLDGHLDLFTPRNSRTGELAGMALAAATGYVSEQLPEIAGSVPLVEPADLVAVGDADGSRRQAYGGAEAATAIPDARVFDARSVRSAGAAATADRIAALVAADDTRCWLHLDVDVLDASVMPAVSFPVSGGIGWDDLEALLESLGADGRLIGISLAGLNVTRDPDHVSAGRLARLLADVFA